MIFTVLINLTIAAILLLLVYLFGDYTRRWWVRVKRTEHIKKEFYDVFAVIEIKLPREINKSPRAMELILDAIHQGAGKNDKPDFKCEFFHKPFYNFEKWRKYFVERYLKGEVLKWMSLEVESREGQLHFYIVTQKKYIKILSAYIYSQYPGIEVLETDDYTDKFRPKIHGGTCDLYTSYITLEGADYLPIKTYIDYELDRDPKEEYKVDPLVPLLESMASVGKGEHVWLQIMARATYNEKWKSESEAAIKKILTKKVKDANGVEKEEIKESTKLTPKEKFEIEAIQKNIEKPGFDCQIKMIYLAEGNNFKSEHDQIVRNSFKSFSNQAYNTFKVNNQNTNYPWMDYGDKKVQTMKRSGWFYLYVMRAMFYSEVYGTATPFKDLVKKWKGYNWYVVKEFLKDDFKGYFSIDEVGSAGLSTHKGNSPYFVLNAEELATIYHFPGKVLGAPNFDRVNSVKLDPPSNLPI